MKQIEVLRDYNIAGTYLGRVGQKKSVSEEECAYLLQYNTQKPLVKVIEAKAADDKKGT